MFKYLISKTLWAFLRKRTQKKIVADLTVPLPPELQQIAFKRLAKKWDEDLQRRHYKDRCCKVVKFFKTNER